MIPSLLLLMAAAAPSPEPGFVPLFDGKTLDGWYFVERKGDSYRVEDGKLVCPAGSTGNLYTKKEYSNFVLRFEFLIGPDANSGIAIRAPGGSGRASMEGLEIQIIDHQGPLYGKRIPPLRPEQLHGAVYDLIPARTGYLKVGEWNRQEITAGGRRIRVVLNGVILLDTSLDIIREPEVLEKHPGLRRTTGHIGLLGHTSRLEFRNLWIKELP